MGWQGVLIGALMMPGAAAASAQDALKTDQVCTALVLPSVTGAQGNAVDLGETVRALFASYLTGPSLKSVVIAARLPAQAVEEARQRQCERVLLVSITQKRAGKSGGVGKTIASAGSAAAWYLPGSGIGADVARTAAAGVSSAVGSIASGTQARDEIAMTYTLKTLDERVLLTRSDKAKAQSNGEDLLTPLVERAATAIAVAPSK
jgi:hypothetical protein